MWEGDHGRDFSLEKETVVCVNCFGDYAIKKFIKENDTKLPCSYCEVRGEYSCHLETVLHHMVSGINTEWGDPSNEGAYYESREGGFGVPLYNIIDILDFKISNDTLLNEICSAFADIQYCKKSPYSLAEHEILNYGWENFSKLIKNETRYIFLDTKSQPYYEHHSEEIHPVEILDELARIAKASKLIQSIGKGTPIYRTRIVDLNTNLTTASDLGSPPEHLTISNRMSPAGISMFYGAFSSKISILETCNPPLPKNKKAIVAIFYPTRDLAVLDLSKSPSIPSIFDSERREERTDKRFLAEFINDFTKPIEKNDKSHVEYVPTQVVTEYFRHIFQTDNGAKLDGIMYESSKSLENLSTFENSAIVLFANNEQCVDSEQDINAKSKYSKEKVLILDRYEAKNY